MKSLSRCSEKIVSLMMITIMTLTIVVCSFSFESNASEAFYVDYNEPTSNENSGYINILARSKITGVKMLHTFYWTIEPYTQSDASSLSATHMSINITNNGTVTFNAYCSASVKAHVTIMFYDGNGNVESNYINDTIPSGEIFRTYSLNSSSMYYYEGYQVFGNYGNITSDFGSSFFTVVYGDTKKEIEEQKESNTWLQKIWTSIQKFFKGDNAVDDTKVEEFNSTSKEQSETLNDLNEQNKTDKIDVDSTSSEVESNIDTDAIGNYGTVLSVFTSNAHILQYILIVLAVALIAYVLFGKR